MPLQNSLLELPVEIRQRIYFFALSWPALDKAFAAASRVCEELAPDPSTAFSKHPLPPKCTISLGYVRPHCFVTPGCLLLCRQITAEALPILLAQPLRIAKLPPRAPMLGGPMELAAFISERLLQRVQNVTLEIDLTRDAEGWRRALDALLDIWAEDNKLVHLSVIVDVEPEAHSPAYYREDNVSLVAPATRVLAKLRRLGWAVPMAWKSLP
ncbi:hypothetical protein CMUS01_16332 [Colletotrichum musicola]|uniref:Uncharacterized protein n=2 Tax=Colletotrichum orchidearum species complex TaxID=2707337 RepID=A0A8H6IPJ9_9PEZI|nr:hypothetical protein CSOJ01_15947 [Colletotrichum sojae]KAF6789377.1 hypothetical protein CMUS01_16332 [Colletotrichum musicola]